MTHVSAHSVRQKRGEFFLPLSFAPFRHSMDWMVPTNIKKKKKSECALLSLLIPGLRKMRYRRHQSKAKHFQL